MLSLEQIASAASGKWLANPEDLNSCPAKIETDSRKDCKGTVFIAFSGENFDAHDYLDQVISSGAASVCVEKKPSAETQLLAKVYNCGILLVKSTIAAYQQIASGWLSANKCKVMGITGSSGKTSVKSIMGSLLEAVAPGNVLSTIANTNNHIGVPQNILRLKESDEYAVLEMGTNNPGEIAVLAQCAPPDIAIITSIGDSHSGNFAEGGILQEKSDIIRFMKSDGIAVIPFCCIEDIRSTDALDGKEFITFGIEPEADFSAECISESLYGSEVILRKKRDALFEGNISLTGKHQAANLAACAAVLDSLGFSSDIYKSVLQDLRLPGMRMRVTEYNEVTWINDAYNANPQSTAAFINWFKGLELNNRVFLVLGDMLELGEKSAEFHEEIAKMTPPDWNVIVVGEHYSSAFGSSARCFTKSIEAVTALKPLPGDVIALKGSRGIKLELIQKHFEDKE